MGAQKPGLSSFVKGRVLKKTRMHSSRLSHSSSHRGGGGCLSACWDTQTPGCGPGDPKVWAWRHARCGPGDPPQCEPGETPLGVGLETPRCRPGDPPGQTPQLPLFMWVWRPLARPLNFPPGCGPGNLQGLLGYHPPWRPAARHAGISPCGQNHSHV